MDDLEKAITMSVASMPAPDELIIEEHNGILFKVEIQHRQSCGAHVINNFIYNAFSFYPKKEILFDKHAAVCTRGMNIDDVVTQIRNNPVLELYESENNFDDFDINKIDGVIIHKYDHYTVFVKKNDGWYQIESIRPSPSGERKTHVTKTAELEKDIQDRLKDYKNGKFDRIFECIFFSLKQDIDKTKYVHKFAKYFSNAEIARKGITTEIKRNDKILKPKWLIPQDWSLAIIGTDDWIQRSKECIVYVQNGTELDDIKSLLNRKVYTRNWLSGPRQIKSTYEELYIQKQQLPPSIALYMHAMIKRKNQFVKIHVINSVEYRFGQYEVDHAYFMEYQYGKQSHNQRIIKVTEFVQGLTLKFRLIFQCAVDKNLTKVAFCLFENIYQNWFHGPVVNEDQYNNLFIQALKISIISYKNKIKEINIFGLHLTKPLIKLFKQTVTESNLICNIIKGHIPDILTGDTLFMNSWNPHAIVGNGKGYFDTNLDAEFGICSDMGYMSNSSINPYLRTVIDVANPGFENTSSLTVTSNPVTATLTAAPTVAHSPQSTRKKRQQCTNEIECLRQDVLQLIDLLRGKNDEPSSEDHYEENRSEAQPLSKINHATPSHTKKNTSPPTNKTRKKSWSETFFGKEKPVFQKNVDVTEKPYIRRSTNSQPLAQNF